MQVMNESSYDPKNNARGEDDPIAVTPKDKQHWLEMRAKNINSTDISALFGVNPYLTEFELWHRLKAGEVVQIEENERMTWGNNLEAAIATEAAKRLGNGCFPAKDYLYLPHSRLGSSFDYITDNNILLECKNVDSMSYSKNWIDLDGVIEAPPHIEIQVQQQLLVSGLSEAYICALVGGNTLKMTHRKWNPKIHELIRVKADKFWKSIDENKPPKIDYQRDSEFLISLYDYAEPNKIIEATPQLDDLVSNYNSVSAQIRELESEKDKYKAMILEAIGDAEKVKGAKYTISAGITAESTVSFVRKSFRNFKVTNKRGKDE